MFGTNYLRESVFSAMKYIKKQTKDKTDPSHSEACLRISTSDYLTDVSEVLDNIQPQGTH
jgi:hypothetical protein